MGNKGPAHFDKYDEEGEVASLGDRCTFCRIIQSNMQLSDNERTLLHEDEHCVIFRDIKNVATAHYQCVPKRHIKHFTHMRLEE